MQKRSEQNIDYARVAQWWSIALPRRGSRVRIPSRAFFVPQMLKNLRFFIFYLEKPAANEYMSFTAGSLLLNFIRILNPIYPLQGIIDSFL